jgi:hypothetical protein
MRAVVIYFTSGESLCLNMSTDEAKELLRMLTAGPGSTTINGDNGTMYLFNRNEMTHVEVT